MGKKRPKAAKPKRKQKPKYTAEELRALIDNKQQAIEYLSGDQTAECKKLETDRDELKEMLADLEGK